MKKRYCCPICKEEIMIMNGKFIPMCTHITLAQKTLGDFEEIRYRIADGEQNVMLVERLAR